MVKARFKRDDLPQFWKRFQLQICFSSLLPEKLFYFMRDFLAYLKSPQVYMCISQSANCLEFVLDIIMNKSEYL